MDSRIPLTAMMNGTGELSTRNGSSSFFKENSSGRVPQMDQKELFKSVDSGINFDKYEDIDVQFSGENAPKPITLFTDLKLHADVEENINQSGYSKPTPVQKYSIPTLLEGRDLMSCAQTGSGKTAAFLVPIINHILVRGSQTIKQKTISTNGRSTYYPAALILAPTRELVMQIHKEALKFSNKTGFEPAMLYGGRENYRIQINQLQYGAHILIATPGRLVDCINEGHISLDGCRFFVLDEADRMLDMGFEPQIRAVVALGNLPPSSERLTAMFSATFPKQIQALAQSFLKSDYMFLSVGRIGSTSENIHQSLQWVEKFDKRKALLQILESEGDGSLVLVFLQTKRGCDELVYFLDSQGIRAIAIHGDLKQHERERNLHSFKSGTRNVLIATAVAARGLDIPNVIHVVNFDLPTDIDEYVHRIGRTGRCGNLGKATSFFNSENYNLQQDLLKIFQEGKFEIPDFLLSGGGSRASSYTSARRFGAHDSRRNTYSPFNSSIASGNPGGCFGSSSVFGSQAMSAANYTSRPSGDFQALGRSTGPAVGHKREFVPGMNSSGNGGFGTTSFNGGGAYSQMYYPYCATPNNLGYVTAPNNPGYVTAPNNPGYVTASSNAGYANSPQHGGFSAAYSTSVTGYNQRSGFTSTNHTSSYVQRSNGGFSDALSGGLVQRGFAPPNNYYGNVDF